MDIYGGAHVATVKGTITWSGFSANALLDIYKADWEDGPAIPYVRDGRGKVVAMEDHGNEPAIVVEAYPFAASGGNTLANSLLALDVPPRPCKVTLGGIKEPSSNKYNGDWLYNGGGKTGQSEGVAMVTIPLSRPATDLTIDQLVTKITA